MLDAEPLLLVDDDKAEILELDLGVEQLVGADDDVDATRLQSLDGLVDLLGRLEAAHGRDGDREALVPFGERLVMLLHEQRSRHEDGHLLAVLYGLERCSHGDLGLAEADVAADEAIHRHWFLHVGLDIVDGGELVRRLLIRERVLQLLLPWRVGAEREPLGALPGRVQLHQVLGDLVHVLARLRLGCGPVGAAELVELGGLRADVFADQIQLIGGDEQLVGRGAALAGRVFDDKVFARGLVRPGADGALPHLQETADAVLLMDHVVSGFELHQVDCLAAALGGLRLTGRTGPSGQVAFGEQRGLRRRVDEPVDGLGADDVERGDAGLVDGSLQSCERALRGRGDGDLVPCVDEPLDAGRGLRLVTAVFARVAGGELHVVRAAGVHAETGEVPHVVAGVCERVDGLLVVEEAGLVEADGSSGTVPGRGDMPAGGEELVRGFREVVRRAAQLFRVGEHDDGMPVEHAGHGFHVVDERGHQGFHAFDGNRVRDGLQHVVGIRNLPDEPFRPVPHGVGELQFTAGRRPDRADALAVGALVGRVEFSDGVDLVTEELDAHRMWRGWGKDVDDAAAHRELATVHHQIDARVGVLNQSARHVVERQLLALREDERIDVAEPLDNGLDQRTHRHDKYADRSEHRIGVAGVREPAEYGHAARHGVGTGTEPLVGQRLPGLQLCDVVRVAAVPRPQRVHGVLGLAAGGHDQDDGGVFRLRCGDGRAQPVRGAHGDDRGDVLAVGDAHAAADEPMECRILIEPFEDAAQGAVDQRVLDACGRGGGRFAARASLLSGH